MNIPITKIRNALDNAVGHYQNNRRQFPWRETDDSYRILVSEYMLQQTQTERVIEKYICFIKRFPTVQALARAERKDVLSAWIGLGYNRRAVALHNAAKMISDRYDNIVPDTAEDLLCLPGVGTYTAGAVMAFAYNREVVIIETNIRTVILHHCMSNEDNVSDGDILRHVEKICMLAKRRNISPRMLYSMLMDYGAHLKKNGIRLNTRSRHYTRQTSFCGSVRQARGELVRHLINQRSGISKKHVETMNITHGKKALSGLIADGIVEERKGRYCLTDR